MNLLNNLSELTTQNMEAILPSKKHKAPSRDILSELATQNIEAVFPPEKYTTSPNIPPLQQLKKIAIFLSLLLFLGAIYLYTSRIILHNSDNASILLQAHDLIHTSKILNGWYLPTDNFITLDMPLYALGLMLGLNMHVLMKLIPVLLYTGVILSGIYLASLGKKGKQRVFAAMACMAIIAFPSYTTTTQVLQGPIHMGTILGTLLAFIAYYFYKERSYKIISLIILGILTLLLIIGDPMSEIILVLPIILVEAILLYQRRFKSRNQYVIIGTVLLSTVIALYIRHVWEHYIHISTFNTLDFENLPTIIKNMQNATLVTFSLFNGEIFQRNIYSMGIIPKLLDAITILLLVTGIWKWLKKSFSLKTSQDALTTALVFAIISNIFIFICTNLADDVIIRYLLPTFIFGGIIAFSTLSYIKKPELYIGIIAFFILNGFLFFHMLYITPPVVQPEKQVISFLQEKHLTKGIGQYWSAASITGQSNYTITIRQVRVTHHRIHPYFLLSNDSWFHDALKDSQFIIYQTTDQGFYNASIGSFGKPDHLYTIGNYIILVWNTPVLSHSKHGYHFYITN